MSTPTSSQIFGAEDLWEKLVLVGQDVSVDDVEVFVCTQMFTWTNMCDAASVTYDHMNRTHPCLYHRTTPLDPKKDDKTASEK
jgi:hypothetical protein